MDDNTQNPIVEEEDVAQVALPTDDDGQNTQEQEKESNPNNDPEKPSQDEPKPDPQPDVEVDPEEDRTQKVIKSLSGKIAAVESENSKYKKVETVLQAINSGDNQQIAKVIGQMEDDVDLYNRVRAYVPGLSQMDHEAYKQSMRQKLNPQDKQIVEMQKRVSKVERESQDQIQLETLKARQMAKLEQDIPAFGSMSRNNETAGKAHAQYEAALKSAQIKYQAQTNYGYAMSPQEFEDLVKSELISFDSKYTQTKAQVTQQVADVVQAVGTTTPSHKSREISPEDQPLYDALLKSYKKYNSPEEADRLARNNLYG